MQSHKRRWQEDLFIAAPLSSLVPNDHILKRVDRVLDLSWVHDAVRHCYCQDNGRPSIDPEAALRLMLAGFFYNITQDRALMREAQSNIAIRWFMGYRLDEALPDRSSLTYLRQRWGATLFKELFARVLGQCLKAGLVSAETVHVDATLIRADVSWDSLTVRHVERVLEENEADEKQDEDHPPSPPAADGPTGGQPRPSKPKKYSPTDPDATMATSCKQYHLEPSYKQHTAVEDANGVVVDVAVTTGEASEGKQLVEQLARIETNTGQQVRTLTADSAYAHPANYEALEQQGIDAVIPPQRTRSWKRKKDKIERIPARRFTHDAHHDRIICPNGAILTRRGRNSQDSGSYYRARSCDCKGCPLRARCISPKASARQLLIVDGYAALLRARRRKERGWDEATRAHYTRHRWRVEGAHGRAKTQHGLDRATRRGLANVSIQAYLTAVAMNLKVLAKALAAHIPAFLPVRATAQGMICFPRQFSLLEAA